MSAAVIGILLLVVVLGAVGGFMFSKWSAAQIPWKAIPGSTAKYHIVDGAQVYDHDVRIAYTDALILLRRHTDFTPLTLAKMASEVHIVVQKVEKWDSPVHGGKVAGIADGITLFIGRDMKSLLHEMAHACEFLEGAIDYSHATWAKRGIHAASDAFEMLRSDGSIAQT